MKAIKFFAMAVAAVSLLALSACGNGNESAASFSVFQTEEITNEGGVELKNDASIEITHFDGIEMLAHLYIKNNTNAEQSYTIKEIRNFDNSKYNTSMCVSTCMMGNQEKEQTWNAFKVKAGEVQTFQSHLSIPTDSRDVAVTCPLVLEITDGKDTFTVTVNFNYTPAN